MRQSKSKMIDSFQFFATIKNRQSKMDTAVAEKSNAKFHPVLSRPVETPKKKSFEEAVAECKGITVDEFFDELDERIKKRFHA
jgi:hypothetical protein